AKQLDVYSDLRGMLEEIIYQGKRIPYSTLVRSVNLGLMFGYVKADDGYITVANRIFEMALLDMFMAEEACQSEAYRYGQRDRNQFVSNGRLNMDLVLEKFVEHYNDIYGESDEKFIEEYGRKFFLLYLKPIINGTGNYYLEARTRDARRTDVIVDYLGEQFIVELKIWHGNEYNERGEAQLTGYLDYYHQQKGYMLSFNFNKRKEVGIKEIQIGDKIIMEAVV
ncbi:MAG: 9-O-acetyl-N-acetylneuraminate esterase, partial [Lachnospiraceae bacterium]|nr:9-O-acetyl-N-acetylneuraminate esterase [Lachnospiraceae bacterium]